MKAWYTVTRNMQGLRARYDVSASSSEDAVKRVEALLGGPFTGLESVEETDEDTIMAEQEDAGYTPRM